MYGMNGITNRTPCSFDEPDVEKIRNERISDATLSVLLWTFGATLYYFCEVIYKYIMGRPEAISWTMIPVAFIICIPLECCNNKFVQWEWPLLFQALVCSMFITVVEFFSGLIINVWLGMHVWDYSARQFNLMGQICLAFCIVWYFASILGIIILDWGRYLVKGGVRPSYELLRFNSKVYNYSSF